jgi:DNA transformation protein
MSKKAARKTLRSKRSRPAAKRGRTMGKFRSMKVSEGFKALVLDHLSPLDDVVVRPMFGGIGLYSRGWFFGILASDVLYLKADQVLRQQIERAGGIPFHPFVDRPASMNYFSVPALILENPAELLARARRSVAVAARASNRSTARRPKAGRSK